MLNVFESRCSFLSVWTGGVTAGPGGARGRSLGSAAVLGVVSGDVDVWDIGGIIRGVGVVV